MSVKERLNKNLDNYKLIRELQDKIGVFRGETVLQLFKRYQKISTPVLAPEILHYREFTDKWKNLFEKEKYNLQACLNPKNVEQIEHIGSTSIKNQSSNNIIDIAVTTSVTAMNEVNAKIHEIGYTYFGNSPLSKDAVWYWKTDQKSGVAFVLHIDTEENLWFQDTLNFRDFLKGLKI